jgi:hypothetical protein
MSRTDKFRAHDAFYRAEARPDGEKWMIAVYRNGSLASVTGEYPGPARSLTDRALAFVFQAVRDLADRGIWEPGATTRNPWNARKGE